MGDTFKRIVGKQIVQVDSHDGVLKWWVEKGRLKTLNGKLKQGNRRVDNTLAIASLELYPSSE
jgi:hypothetical protein